MQNLMLLMMLMILGGVLAVAVEGPINANVEDQNHAYSAKIVEKIFGQ